MRRIENSDPLCANWLDLSRPTAVTIKHDMQAHADAVWQILSEPQLKYPLYTVHMVLLTAFYLEIFTYD